MIPGVYDYESGRVVINSEKKLRGTIVVKGKFPDPGVLVVSVNGVDADVVGRLYCSTHSISRFL